MWLKIRGNLCAICLAVAGIAMASGSSRGEASTEVLSAYEQYLDSLQVLSFDFEYSTYESGGAIGPDERLIEVARGSASARDQEFRFRHRNRYVIWYAGKPEPHDIDSEEVITSEWKLHFQGNYETDSLPFEVKDFPADSTSYEATSWEIDRGDRFENLDYVMHVLYGSFPYDNGKDVLSILQTDPTSTVTDEKVDGHDVKRVTAKTSYGIYSVFLDTIANVPRRIEVRKVVDSLYLGKPLSSFPPIKDRGDRHPHGQLLEYRVDVNKVALTEVPDTDRWIGSQFEILETRLYEGDQSFRQRRVVKLSNIRFQCEDEDLRPTVPVQNGARVFFQDAPNIKGEWHDGQIVKVVNEEALERFDGLEPTINVRRRWLLIGLNAGVVLIILCLLVMRR
jgi:hypothetical protein